MKINKIGIKNFKFFENAEFEFKKQFTVLLGNNGKGKSSILDALAIGISTYLIGLDGTPNRQLRRNEIRYQSFEPDSIEHQVPVVLSLSGVVNNQQMNWERVQEVVGNKKTFSMSREKYARNIISLAKEMQSSLRNGGEVSLPLIAYHGTGRLWSEKRERKISYKKKTSRMDGYYGSLDPESITKAFLSWFKTFEDGVIKRGKDKTLYNAFVRAIEIATGWKEIHFSWEEDDMMGYLELDNKWHPLSSLSDGYRGIVGLVADLAYRCIKLNPHLGENAVVDTAGIVLIDELDMHLHPNWQKHVIADLKTIFPNLQFVATTHSPFIVQSLEADEVINLDTKTTENPYEKSIEDIAEEDMLVEDVQRSEKFLNMISVAENYFKLIEEGKTMEDKELRLLKEKLDILAMPFEKNPAYVALLKAERKSELGI